MAATLLLAAAMLASGAPAATGADGAAAEPESINVAFEEMTQKRSEAAIARIRADREVDSDDPAALINLGTAYARLGRG